MYSFPTTKGFVSSSIKQSDTIVDKTNQIIPKYLYLKTTQTNDQYVNLKDIGTYYTNFAIKETQDPERRITIHYNKYNYLTDNYISNVYMSIATRNPYRGQYYLSFCFDMPNSTPFSLLICDIFNNPIFEVNAIYDSQHEEPFEIELRGPVPSTYTEPMISYYKSFINE